MNNSRFKTHEPHYIVFLRAVEKYRFLTISQVQVLFNLPSYSEARRILYDLWQKKCLERLVLTKAANWISICYAFALGRYGAQKLTLMDGREGVFFLKPNSKRSVIFLEHSILINNFRVCLESVLKRRRDFQLLFWKQEKKEVKLHYDDY